jgi:hypothetical protein
MPANSNAIAIVTIQDQDLLSAGQPNVVQRLSAQVTFPSSNGIQYSGYQVVTSNIFIPVAPAATQLSFAYIRNASPFSANGVLEVGYTLLGGTPSTLELAPGGIFLFANPSIAMGPVSSSTIGNLQVLVNSGTSIIMEYMWAY